MQQDNSAGAQNRPSHYGLKDKLEEREREIKALKDDLRQREATIDQLQATAVQISHRLRQARSSLGWRLFWPLRMMRDLLGRLGHGTRVDLVPLSRLEAEDGAWHASGSDPQFLLVAERNWPGLAGWCWLDVHSAAARPLNAQLCFDLGTGFDESRVIDFQLSGKGSQRIPLYIPAKCYAIRLDPHDAPQRFGLSVRGIMRLKNAPELPPEFLGQSNVFEALGGRAGSAAALEAAGGVVPDEAGEYDWRTEGNDPRFLVRRASQKLLPGWHRVELRMRADPGRGNAKLYFDHGDGYNEVDCLALPFDDGEVIERVFRVTSAPRQVRFDPLETRGKFSVERLYFTPAGPMFARNSMLRRVAGHSAHYRGRPVGAIWRDLQAAAIARGSSAGELLLQRYNESFPAYGPHDAVSYAEWIARIETPEFSDAEGIDTARRAFTHQPVIAVVMPVYHTAEAFLRRAIESVLAQSYPQWELCIADDASPEPHVRRVLEEYARNDPRIKVTFRSENGHISAASNSALALASGEYVALLDHDDELAPHALHFVAQAINHNRFAQIFYSDEDKIDEAGERLEPHYKADWNPDLFFSQNYVSHLAVYRRELLERIGGFRAGVEGSQDYDLLLRCLPHVNSAGIVHIPKVLYHWRRLEGSTAYGSGEKHYTTDAGIRALEDYFRSQGREDVKVEGGLVPNTYRVRYPIPRPEPLISLLIPTRDKVEFLEACVRSVLGKTSYPNLEIIIIDNGSAEAATHDYFRRIQAEDSRVRVLPYPYPFNFAAINNFGVRHARGELVGLVNNDIEVISPEWLTEMASHALRPDIGCVGAKLYYADETIQHAGVIAGLGGVAGHSHKYFPRAASGYFHRLKIIQNLSAVTAACMVVRKSVYEQVGGMEEAGLGIAFNDVDFCLKVREAGYRNLWTPYAELYHYESKSRGAEDTPDKVERFNNEADFMKVKWGAMLRCDPCYNRNLTLTREDFSLGGGS